MPVASTIFQTGLKKEDDIIIQSRSSTLEEIKHLKQDVNKTQSSANIASYNEIAFKQKLLLRDIYLTKFTLTFPKQL